jgi:hypothetical protein
MNVLLQLYAFSIHSYTVHQYFNENSVYWTSVIRA